MISVAKAQYMRITPNKVRMVLGLIRGKNVNDAFNILTFTKKRVASILHEILTSAVANAKNKEEDVDANTLFISRIYANEGPSSKRFLPRAMGRATEIIKRTSHITIELDKKISPGKTAEPESKAEQGHKKERET